MAKLLIGPHLSIAQGFAGAVAMAETVGATAMQIFTKSNRSWFAPAIKPLEAEAFKLARQNLQLEAVVVHACYLINLASSNPLVEANSVKSLRLEMQRCQALGIGDLVLHPGAHTGQGVERGLEQLVKNLTQILATDQTGTRILLENMAGQGTTLGADFAQLKAVLTGVAKTSQLGFCLDSCHAFAAGYDLVSAAGFEATVQAIETQLGWQHVHALHLNDSKTPLGSGKDRHANLGVGQIGQAGLKQLLQHEQFKQLPMLLETPDEHGLEGYAKEIVLAKALSH